MTDLRPVSALLALLALSACGGRKAADRVVPRDGGGESAPDRFTASDAPDMPGDVATDVLTDVATDSQAIEAPAADAPAVDALSADSPAAESARESGTDSPPDGVVSPLMMNLTISSLSVAGAAGSITLTPEGAGCGPNCFTYKQGEMVVLRAIPTAPSRFAAWSVDCKAEATDSCRLMMSTNRTAAAHFRPNMNLMFVTSTTIAPKDIGTSLAGADALCVKSAHDAFLGGSNWRAWLSTTSGTTNINAATRVGVATPGWLRVDGKPFASSTTALLAGAIFYPPRITEVGTDRGEFYFALTGTAQDGTPLSGSNCGDWTSEVGSPVGGDLRRTTVEWTRGSSILNACSSTHPIYCFQNDPEMVAVVPPSIPASARRAFLSTTYWTPGGGVVAADSVCQSDATAAQLPNPANYRALLTTTIAAADPSRISLTGPPWFRLDGAQVVASAADLAPPTGSKLLTTMNVTSRREYSTYFAAWSGNGTSPGSTSLTENCNNWQSADSSLMGWWGSITSTGSYNMQSLFWAAGKRACDLGAPVYCFEK